MRLIDWIVNIATFLLVCYGMGAAGTAGFAVLPISAVLWLYYQSQRARSLSGGR
jgi:hypothetical protein